MKLFTVPSENAETSGIGILSIIEGMGVFKHNAIRILAKYGIVDPQADGWYSMQAYMDAYKEIATKIGPSTLRVIGKKIPEMVPWPPEIDTIEKVLGALDGAYQMNHRGGDVGHYRFEKTGERSGKMICDNPYPCYLDEGITIGTAKRFAPSGTRVVVRHDKSEPCRQDGGDRCIYLISW